VIEPTLVLVHRLLRHPHPSLQRHATHTIAVHTVTIHAITDTIAVTVAVVVVWCGCERVDRLRAR
jgi:hypothetical protein